LITKNTPATLEASKGRADDLGRGEWVNDFFNKKNGGCELVNEIFSEKGSE